MKYCGKCGSKINDNDNFCMICGAAIIEPSSNQSYYNRPQYHSQCSNPYPAYNADRNSTGLNILSFCFPMIGLILYLVFKDEKTIKAKGCGKWALISFIASLILLPFTTMFWFYML